MNVHYSHVTGVIILLMYTRIHSLTWFPVDKHTAELNVSHANSLMNAVGLLTEANTWIMFVGLGPLCLNPQIIIDLKDCKSLQGIAP